MKRAPTASAPADLQNISTILECSGQLLLRGRTGRSGHRSQPGMAEANSSNYVVDFLSSSEGLQLNRAFIKIPDPKVRRKLVDLVKSLASEPDSE
jgi:hypothetical protein